MKKNKLILLVSIITVLLVGVASVAYAAVDAKTPAEIVAGLTGKSVDEVTAARQAGKPYGAQAIEADKQVEFQAAKLENYKLRLDEAVAAGRLSREEADKLYEAMKTRLADCDGTCTGNAEVRGAGQGLGNGAGTGTGSGTGMMNRGGQGKTGRGMGGDRLGTCTATPVQ